MTLSFATLLDRDTALHLLRHLEVIIKNKTDNFQLSHLHNLLTHLDLKALDVNLDEPRATAWLIKLFNTLFFEQRVELVHGTCEPEYFPATTKNFARIEFAHGFFASALHEISHWCIAGKSRRLINDFGYWYAPDGRSEAQQQAFERVEIKPQAIECLFTLACHRPFQVSQDNLFADFDTSNSTFADDVYQQASRYISQPETLPYDAKVLLWALLQLNLSKLS